eukprot:GHVQ01037167.1.p1 GENE.GHVQ01037167.1~~GHVQ01037167.1.p1  ORF type:complete len:264 (-),score=27.50 GHVQ01037167.1:239-1030(-)
MSQLPPPALSDIDVQQRQREDMESSPTTVCSLSRATSSLASLHVTTNSEYGWNAGFACCRSSAAGNRQRTSQPQKLSSHQRCGIAETGIDSGAVNYFDLTPSHVFLKLEGRPSQRVVRPPVDGADRQLGDLRSCDNRPSCQNPQLCIKNANAQSSCSLLHVGKPTTSTARSTGPRTCHACHIKSERESYINTRVAQETETPQRQSAHVQAPSRSLGSCNWNLALFLAQDKIRFSGASTASYTKANAVEQEEGTSVVQAKRGHS